MIRFSLLVLPLCLLGCAAPKQESLDARLVHYDKKWQDKVEKQFEKKRRRDAWLDGYSSNADARYDRWVDGVMGN